MNERNDLNLRSLSELCNTFLPLQVNLWFFKSFFNLNFFFQVSYLYKMVSTLADVDKNVSLLFTNRHFLCNIGVQFCFFRYSCITLYLCKIINKITCNKTFEWRIIFSLVKQLYRRPIIYFPYFKSSFINLLVYRVWNRPTHFNVKMVKNKQHSMFSYLQFYDKIMWYFSHSKMRLQERSWQ